MRNIFLLLSISIFSVVSQISFAQVTESISTTKVSTAIASGPFKIGIGSTIEINSASNIFLGNLLNANGSANSLMVLDTKQSTIHYAHSTATKDFQSILKLFPQQGGTCTGYAINDFLIQNQLSGLVGNGKLAQDLSTEEGRSALLADSINQYYLVTQHRFSILGILNLYGKTYGFTCRKKLFTDSRSAQKFIVDETAQAHPVLLSFNIGPDMYDGPFNLAIDNNNGILEDVRLWLPRKIGQRSHGGHSVVAAGRFNVGESNYFVMLDSDWNLPRVWDANQALGDRTAIKEIEFYTCK